MPTEPQPPPSPDAVAAAWIERRDAGLAPHERAELAAWLDASPAHRAALARADRRRTDVDWALHAGAIDEVLDGLAQRAHERRVRRRRMMIGGLAAAAAVAFGLFLRPAPVAESAARPATITLAAARRITLPDGSVAELHERASLALNFSAGERRVTLSDGVAHFAVVPDKSRPFIVTAGRVEVRAVGTAFSVQPGRDETEVVVTEGRVAVTQDVGGRPDAAPVLVDSGYALVLPTQPAAGGAGAPEALSADELRERLAWRAPRLEFADAPLAEVVSAMNRHNRVQFVIVDRELAGRRLSGAVRADKTAALEEILAKDFSARLEREGDRVLIHAGTAR